MSIRRSLAIGILAPVVAAPLAVPHLRRASGLTPTVASVRPVQESRAPPAISFTRIPDALGLSHNSVYAIAQDPFGFLWVGTADGLNRYDGYGFRVYRHDPADDSSPSANLVWDLHVDHTGTLWVLTSHGVDRYVPEEDGFARYAVPGGTREAAPQTRMLETADGRLWVSNDADLFVYDRSTDRFEPRPLPSGTGTGAITALAEGPLGEVWLARRGPPVTIVGLDTGRSVEVGDVQWISALHARPEAEGADELALAPGFSYGPTPSGEAPARLGWPTERGFVWDITSGTDGRLWFATGRGLYSEEPGGAPMLHMLDPTESAYVFNYGRSVFIDRTGAVWVGTHGGLFRHDPYAKPFVHLPGDPANEEELSGSSVSAVHVDARRDVWVGTLGRGLNRIDGETGAIERYGHRPGDPTSLPHDRVWSLHVDSAGSVWVGTQGGLAELDPATGRFRRHSLPGPDGGPAATPAVRRIEATGDGRLWVAGGGALHRYDPATGRSEVFAAGGDEGSGPSQAELFAILPTPDGAWIGAGGSHLDRFDSRSGHFTSIELRSPDGMPLSGEGIWDAVLDPGGVVWLGTGSGLGRFDPRDGSFTLLTTADGLPGSVVYSIVRDRAGRLWLGTNQGLARFDPAADPGERVRNFDLGDGIGSLEFNRAAAFESATGELLMGGMNGLTRFFPDAIVENPVVPPVVLTGVTTASEERVRRHVVAGLSGLELPHGESTVTFEFAALSFTNPSQNRYEYRLEPIETQWVAAGDTRLARYPRLPSGDYRFYVRGSNNDGEWNLVGASIAFRIVPPFWETVWFRGLVAALVAGLLYGGYRYRVAQLLAVERLRMRVAGDLHDDLSSNLSGIALMSEMVARDERLASGARRRLAKIADAARGMGDDVRDMVWIVDTGHDSLEDLSLKMKDAAARLLVGHDYRFDVRVDGVGDKLPVEFRRHAYLAFKEMAHNVARHAGAERVVVTARTDGGILEVSVEDDGVGFQPTGDDLRSLGRRASELGGELQVRSRPGEGTTVTIRAPVP